METNIQLQPNLILLSQPVLTPIPESSMVMALSDSMVRLPRKSIELAPVRADLTEMPTFPWSEAQRLQKLRFDADLKPLLEGFGGTAVAYFGAAPIPLAIHLGFLLGNWKKTEIFLHHHKRRDWKWALSSPPSNPITIKRTPAPKEIVTAEGDVIIRIWTSHKINNLDTQAVVPSSLAEFDIFIGDHEEDALRLPEELEQVAEVFKRVLTEIEELRPGATTIHLFASVPVGLAFRMGTLISPTMAAKVQTYQFVSTATARYAPAIVIQDDAAPPKPLSPTEVEDARLLLGTWKRDMPQIQSFVRDYEVRPGVNWLRKIFSGQTDGEGNAAILSLCGINETPLAGSNIDELPGADVDSFQFVKINRTWRFSEFLLSALAKQFEAGEDRVRAGRLLLFHEAVHLSDHRLTGATAPGVGRFPKILEDVDYQADAWAILHEMSYSIFANGTPKNFAALAQSIIFCAINTFWAFDASERFERRIQIRRLHRYLIWYWQALSVEACHSLTDVAKVILDKPRLELAGPHIETIGERVYFSMIKNTLRYPELCILTENRIVRCGNGPTTNIDMLLDGFRTHDGHRILNSLRGFYDSQDNG